MTLFNDGATDPAAPVAPETDEAILQAVTEKFKNQDGQLDVIALAKGKLEADAFIERLKSETHGMREDLNSRVALEDLIADLRKAKAPASSPEPQALANEDAGDKSKSALTLEAVKQLLQDELTQNQKQFQAEQNIRTAEAELTKQWGANTASKLQAKARELDVSLAFLKGIAATRPRAFLEMVGAKASSAVDTQSLTPPKSRQSAPTNTSTGERNYAYYQKLKKENASLYWSPQTQMQEMKDAQRLGEAFYN